MNKFFLVTLLLLLTPFVSAYTGITWHFNDGDVILNTSTIEIDGVDVCQEDGTNCPAGLGGDNESWNETYANTLYAPIGSGNLSWNESYADTLYAPIGSGNLSWNESYADTLYADINTIPDNTSWNQTHADTLYCALGDAVNVTSTFGGEVSGTYDAIFLDNDALDDQYYDSEADLTSLLDDNYAPISTISDNTSWNQTHADTLYADISTIPDNTSWNQTHADTLYSTGPHTVDTQQNYQWRIEVPTSTGTDIITNNTLLRLLQTGTITISNDTQGNITFTGTDHTNLTAEDVAGFLDNATIVREDTTTATCSGTDQLYNITVTQNESGVFLDIDCSSQGSGGGISSLVWGNGTTPETLSDGEHFNITPGRNMTSTQTGGAVTLHAIDTVLDESTVDGYADNNNYLDLDTQDHGDTGGLTDDDHTQYMNQARFNSNTTGWDTDASDDLTTSTIFVNATASRINLTGTGNTLNLSIPADSILGADIDESTVTHDSLSGAGTVDTQEEVTDAAGGMATGNTETLITVTFQDADDTIDYEVTSTLSSYTDDLGHIQDNTSWNQTHADTLYSTGAHYTSSNFDTDFSGKTTDDLTQGTTNWYDNRSWNETRFDTLTTGWDQDASNDIPGGNGECSGTDQVHNVTVNASGVFVDCSSQGSGGGISSLVWGNGTTPETLTDGEHFNITPGRNMSSTQTGGAVTLHAIDTDTQRTDEEITDLAGGMATGNTETLITVTFQDGDDTIDYEVTSTLSSYTDDLGHIQDNTSWNETRANAIYPLRSDWTTIDNYPSACTGNNLVQGLADALTCVNVNTLTAGDANLLLGQAPAFYLNITGFNAGNITSGSIPTTRTDAKDTTADTIADDNVISDTELDNENYGEFTCDGTEDGCTLNTGVYDDEYIELGDIFLNATASRINLTGTWNAINLTIPADSILGADIDESTVTHDSLSGAGTVDTEAEVEAVIFDSDNTGNLYTTGTLNASTLNSTGPTFTGNISLHNAPGQGSLGDNTTCTVITSPNGNSRLEVCN